MKSALALLAALVGLAALVALSCTAPLAGAPCECLPGFECDRAADVCRPIPDASLSDASSFLPTDAAPTPDASDPFDDGGLDPADASTDSDAGPFVPDAGPLEPDAGPFDPDAG